MDNFNKGLSGSCYKSGVTFREREELAPPSIGNRASLRGCKAWHERIVLKKNSYFIEVVAEAVCSLTTVPARGCVG